jgi:3-hydroxyisobutyrate dehydrogenase-like beta-hydroxyacid dehydrogenase
MGEALALVDRAGVDRRQYLEVLTSTSFGAPIYRTYGELIANRKFEPAGFPAPMGAKDVGLALAAAESSRVPMPLAELMLERFRALIDRGGERLDWSAVGFLPAKDSGAPGVLPR